MPPPASHHELEPMLMIAPLPAAIMPGATGLRSTVKLLNYAMRQANVEVDLDIADDLPTITGDTRALNQVFLNLLKNAAEALAGTGGSIDVSARFESDAIVVRICDDGPGIPAVEQDQLFQPFFSTKGAGGGTGLGLSISRRIVVEHGGTIELESGESLEAEVPSESSTTAGSFMVNVEPLPSSLATRTVPPIISQKWRVMASPRPVPPNRPLVDASAWAKA